MKSVSNTKSMTSGDPIRLILAFAAPLLIGNIFQQLYNLVDSAIVGKAVGADALAAVGATSTIQMFTMCLCFGLANGAGVIIAQCFGAKAHAQLRETIGSLVCVVSVVAAVMLTLGVTLAPAVLRLLCVPEDIIGTSVTYFRITMLGAPFVMAYNAGGAILRSMGNSRVPLYMLIISSVVNGGLDCLFVIGLGWGVAGAATATVIAQIVSAAACIGYLYANRKSFELTGLKFRARKESVINILKTGLPAALQSSMISIGNMSVQTLINSFGKPTMAAYTSATKIDSLAIMVVVTMGMSLSVYCGQNIGAGKPERIRSGLYKTLALVLSYCAVLALVMILFGHNLLCIFLNPATDGEAIAIGTEYLKIIGAAYFMAGIMRCYLNVMHGAGDVNVSLVTGMAELAVRIAASYILVAHYGRLGLWIAIPVSWGIASLIPVIRYYSGKWKTKALLLKQS